MELASAFYRTAETDLRVAKLLYTHREYPSAIFYLQQSVEKLSKAYGLINGIIKPDVDAVSRDISHNSKRVFTKQINEHQQKLDRLNTVEEVFPDLLNLRIKGQVLDLKGYNKKFRKASQSILHLQPKDFMWISGEDIDEILKLINEASTQPVVDLHDLENDFPILAEGILQHFKQSAGIEIEELKLLLVDKELISNLTPAIKQYVQTTFEILRIYLTLFFFSLILTEHNQHSRYPCFCCAEAPEDDYHTEEDLVIKFPELWRALRNCFSVFYTVFMSEQPINQD